MFLLFRCELVGMMPSPRVSFFCDESHACLASVLVLVHRASCVCTYLSVFRHLSFQNVCYCVPVVALGLSFRSCLSLRVVLAFFFFRSLFCPALSFLSSCFGCLDVFPLSFLLVVDGVIGVCFFMCLCLLV